MADIAASYISATSFSTSGDVTDVLTVGRKVRANCGVDGYKVAAVTDSTYSSGTGLTTVTVDGEALTSNLTGYLFGVSDVAALPAHEHEATEVSFDNTTSELSAIDIQEAVDEIVSGLGTASSVDTGTTEGTVLLLGPSGKLALPGLLDLSNASAGQIKFPTTQNTSTDAKTLDDYEEGTWTPAIAGSTTAGNGTYSSQVGAYTKIGRIVFISLLLSWSAHTGTGDMQITGLPFTSEAPSSNIAGYVNGFSITGQVSVSIATGASKFGVYSANNGSMLLLPMDTAATIGLQISYVVG